MADRVTVLRNGKVAGAAPIAAITQPELIRMISGANVERYRHWASGIGQAALGKPVLVLGHLSRAGAYKVMRCTARDSEGRAASAHP